jgi:hypothetical protein
MPNPFYDTATNKPKFLGIDGSLPTGSPPLVYLPMRGSDAGNNPGTGGDFTVNSGPYTGARGPAEAWLNAVEYSGSGQYFLRGGDLTGNADSKNVCGMIAVKRDTTGAETLWDSGAGQFRIAFDASNYLVFTGKDAGGNTDLSVRTSAIADTNWHIILFSFGMASTSTRFLYVDNTSDLTVTTYNDDTLDFTATEHAIAATTAGATLFNGKLAIWLGIGQTVDFSQEANRLAWVDAFGFPVDLAESPTGTAPIVFATDPTGDNAGSGGAFTPTGTPTDGGSVKG